MSNRRTLAVTNNLDTFRKEYLGANTWAQRKDGVPLYLLDKLSAEEIKVAETELLEAASLRDDWPIVGLGHIKSKDSIPTLYKLLEKSKSSMRVTIAHSIFQITKDPRMIEVVLETMPRITNEFELITVLYYLPSFKDQRITNLHHSYRDHKKYLVAYNATRYLGLPTDEIVDKFRDKKQRSFWDKILGR